jgi:2-polyprenyl-3-methyl-5-hydroxy-6-metoxy-1,4-benzoquinol methylase
MPNLKNRSYTKELLDADNISFEDIKGTMKELNTINTLLGGHAITVNGINNFKNGNESLHVCEIGCGGGDNLKAIAKSNNAHFIFTGVDLKQECVDFAKQQYADLNATWIASDYSKVAFETKPDVIFSSLFCHHFTEEQLVFMLKWMKDTSAKGFFINDLQRNSIAYFLIKWLTKFFSKSYLVINDGPISVSRGFHKKEWQALFAQAGITNYSIKWKWAFRYLIVCKNK